MDRAMRMMLAAGITLILSGVAFMFYLGYLRGHPPVVSPKPITLAGPPLSIPAFSLVDQDGTARDRSVLEGRVSVVWFMYTRCPIICPAMSVQMADLQRQLKGSGVQFTAFSLDPAHDTPAVMKEYGDRYQIDWSNWMYLTEPAGSVIKRTGWDIFTKDLKQFAEETPGPASKESVPNQPPPPTNIDHAVNFFLVGPDGNVLEKGWFSSKFPEEMKDLRERAIGAVNFYKDKGALKQ